MGLVGEPEFHVLAVDDSIIDRKLIERLLKTSSFQVTTVDSGSKALEFLGCCEEEQIKPNDQSIYSKCQQVMEVNLIITDYCMPGMTGYDLLKKVKESSSLRNIPVVIMSSENVPSRITRSSMIFGMSNYALCYFQMRFGQALFRCLEEGAEEFFLKPVRKSDVNKLRHHMMKTKQFQKNQIPETLENLENPKLQQDQKNQKEENHQQQQPNNNKRKPIEEGLSPDRTRPRYSDLTVVLINPA